MRRAPLRHSQRAQPRRKLWASLKGSELANLCAETLNEPIKTAHRGVERVRSDEDLLFGFLEVTGL
jgi:hypothetical protein